MEKKSRIKNFLNSRPVLGFLAVEAGQSFWIQNGLTAIFSGIMAWASSRVEFISSNLGIFGYLLVGLLAFVLISFAFGAIGYFLIAKQGGLARIPAVIDGGFIESRPEMESATRTINPATVSAVFVDEDQRLVLNGGRGIKDYSAVVVTKKSGVESELGYFSVVLTVIFDGELVSHKPDGWLSVAKDGSSHKVGTQKIDRQMATFYVQKFPKGGNATLGVS